GGHGGPESEVCDAAGSQHLRAIARAVTERPGTRVMGSDPSDGNRARRQTLCDRGRAVAPATRPATAAGPIGQSGGRAQTVGLRETQEGQCAEAGQPSGSSSAAAQGAQVFRLCRGRARQAAVEPAHELDPSRIDSRWTLSAGYQRQCRADSWCRSGQPLQKPLGGGGCILPLEILPARAPGVSLATGSGAQSCADLFPGLLDKPQTGIAVAAKGQDDRSSQPAPPTAKLCAGPFGGGGKVFKTMLTQVPKDLNGTLDKLGLLPLFAHPPAWALASCSK